MPRAARIAILVAALGALALAIRSDLPLCPMASTLGIPCPGCGLTRATISLLHGDWRAALHFHPLVWLLSPLFIAFMTTATLELVRSPATPPRARRVQQNTRALTAAATLVLLMSLGVWLARFAGYFGGPVPVTTMREWIASHRR